MIDIALQGEEAKPGSVLAQIREKAASRQNLPVVTTAPTIATIDEGESKFAYISGVLYEYTRYNNGLYRVAYTAV